MMMVVKSLPIMYCALFGVAANMVLGPASPMPTVPPAFKGSVPEFLTQQFLTQGEPESFAWCHDFYRGTYKLTREELTRLAGGFEADFFKRRNCYVPLQVVERRSLKKKDTRLVTIAP